MTIDTINRTLQERFAAELPDCYQRRIISGSTPTESLKQCWMNWSFPT